MILYRFKTTYFFAGGPRSRPSSDLVCSFRTQEGEICEEGEGEAEDIYDRTDSSDTSDEEDSEDDSGDDSGDEQQREERDELEKDEPMDVKPEFADESVEQKPELVITANQSNNYSIHNFIRSINQTVWLTISQSMN